MLVIFFFLGRGRSTLRSQSVLSSCGGHLFADTAVAQKVGFLPIYEVSQHNVGLMYQDDADVGYSLVTAYFYSLAVKGAVAVITAYIARAYGLFAVLGPLLQVAHTKIILVVHQKFLKAGLRHISEFDFSLFGCAAGGASFGDILLAAARCLDHLIHGSVGSVQKSLREYEGHIIDDLCDTIYHQILIIALLRNKIRHATRS